MSGGTTPLVVDVEGLPRRTALPTLLGVPHLGAYTLFGLGIQGLVRTAFGDGGLVVVLVSLVAVVGGAAGLHLVGARSHVRLDPDGLRRHDGVRLRRRVRAWSTVGEVRPSSRWNDHPELRGTRASDEPVPLVGWSDADALELGRRLAVARRAALDETSVPPAVTARPGAPSTGGVVVDLDGLPGHLVAPTGGRRWRTWAVVGVVVGAALVLWQLLSWLVGDGRPEPWPVVVGAFALWQGARGLALGRRQRVLLRPTGVVAEGAPDDRERPWSTRTSVRLPSRWVGTPQLLHLGGGPVTLWGLDEQQALLLRRRVEEAVARAAAVDTPGTTDGDDGERDGGQVTRPG